MAISMNRRSFLVSAAAVGGAFTLGIQTTRDAAAMPTLNVEFPESNRDTDLGAWISILPDNTVIVRSPMPENGNGVMTQVAMTISEELRCDLTLVAPEFASPTRNYLEDGVYDESGGDIAFFAGRSTSDIRNAVLLQAGASARERLKAAAAARWGIDPTQVEAENSLLTNVESGETLTYGDVALDAAGVELDEEPAIKPEAEWTILGKQSLGKYHTPLVVEGKATYGIDVVPEGVLYAAIKQSPVHGGRLKSYDADAIMDMPGVHSVVEVDPDNPAPEGPVPFFYGMKSKSEAAVAVVAEHYWQAKKALDALPVEWEDGDGAQWTNEQTLRDAAFAALDDEDFDTLTEVGEVSLIDEQNTLVEAEYWTPYTEQAPIEPLNGTCLVTDERVDLWHPTQHTRQAWATVVEESGVAPENVFVHPTFLGGAFGRRVLGDDVRMVVAIAKQVKGHPVQVIWSREEMFRQGRYRPAVASRFKAGLGEDGLPVAVHAKTTGGGVMTAGFHDGPFGTALVPNRLFQVKNLPFHIMTGWYRGPGYNTFAFMVESFVDEMAHAAGIDPLEYRLQMFSDYRDPGWTKCLEVVAEKSGWGKELPKGEGMGVAISNWSMNEEHFGTTVANVAHVEVSQDGELKVKSIDVAMDTGKIMNEDAVRAQYEGGTLFGLNMSLNEELTIENGAIVEGNFDTYPMLRMADVPEINIHLDALTGHDRFGEIGESSVGPVGPAIANAIFAATGIRVREMPFRKADLSWS